jgi:dolichyl-phosphate beta-glucosyltransferase
MNASQSFRFSPHSDGLSAPEVDSLQSPDLSVVIPAYNERGRLPRTLEAIVDYLVRSEWKWEVVVSDDGSKDGSPDMVTSQYPRVRVIRAPVNRGKGAAVARGMLAARGRWRLFSDADLSTPIEELEGMIKAMEAGRYDIVIASRALPGSVLVVRQPWWREAAGRLFNRLVQPMTGLPFVDTQCGFKLFHARAARFLFARQRSVGWAFDVEILMMAQLFGFSILEYPVRWINSEASKVSLLRAGPRMLRDILKYRWWRFTGRMAVEPAVYSADAPSHCESETPGHDPAVR